MAFTQEEIRNFGFKGWNSILGTGNRSTAPDNLTYYEEMTTNALSVYPNQILSDFYLIPPAKNITEASTNAAAQPTIIADFTSTPIHLTPSPNNKAFFATETYGDLSTRLYNFIMPQAIPRTDAGNIGRASIGYGVKLFQGDPNAGGIQINTTMEQSGADVGWFFSYGAGAIVIASDFTAITDPNDVWITSFQYIGKTGGGALTEVPVDDVTIDLKSPGYRIKSSTGNNRYEVIETYWMHGIPSGIDYGWKGCVTRNGAMQVQPQQNNLAVWNDTNAQDVVWDSGTYEFYCTNNIDSLTPQLEDDAGNSYGFINVGKEGVFYRYSVSIPSAKILYFNTMSSALVPYTVYLLDRYDTSINDEITIKNIDTIIDGNSISIDGSFTDKDNAHAELVTRNFVETRIPEADEVTIKSTIKDIELSEQNDYQNLINDAWDNTVTTSGWSIGSNTSYDTGKLSVTLNPANTELVLSHPTATINKANRIVLITNYDMSNGNIFFYDDNSGIYSFYYESGVLQNGDYFYTYSIPAGWTQNDLRVELFSSAPSTETINVQLAKMDIYPPNATFKIKEIDYIIDDDYKSIDGSDTPMSDPHRELVTRAYVDNGGIRGYSQTFTQTDLVSGVLTVNHKLNAKDKITHVTVKNNNNKHINPDDTTDITANKLEVDLQMIEPINGTWTVLVTCISVPKEIKTNKSKELNTRTLNSATLN